MGDTFGGRDLASNLDASMLAAHDNEKLSLKEKNKRMQEQLKVSMCTHTCMHMHHAGCTLEYDKTPN